MDARRTHWLEDDSVLVRVQPSGDPFNSFKERSGHVADRLVSKETTGECRKPSIPQILQGWLQTIHC